MKETLFTILQVALREIRRMTSQSMYLLVTIIFPVATTLFFWSLMKEGVPTKMPVAVVDLDNTALSARLVRNIDVTPLSRVVSHLQSESEAMSELRKGNIYGFVVIPDNLQSDIMMSKKPVISYYYQNSFLIAGGLMQNDLTYILHTLSAGVSKQKLEATGHDENRIMARIQPIVLDTHLLFNPYSNYSAYVTTIILPIMLQLFILLITVYSILSEIKEKTSREWLRLSGKSLPVALAGKLLPYSVIFFIVMMFQNLILYKMLQIPLHTGFLGLAAVSVLFVLAYQAIGIFCAGLFPMMRHALNLSAFYGILALSLCGFSFPVEYMPAVFQFWAEAFPVRHYMHIFQSQMLAGFGIQYAFLSYLFLMLFLFVPFATLFRLKKALILQDSIEKV